MRKIKTAIIGMGRMGRTRYDAMTRHGGFDIVALCDAKEECLEGYPGEKYREWKKCLDEAAPEAIAVCTINRVIPDVVCYGMEKGMAVFSEKPPGRTLKDAERMRDVERRTGAVLKFGFNHRMHNSVIEAKALIDSGLLGQVVCIRGVYGKAGTPHFAEEWRNNPELSGGGILLDQGIHMLDLMCYLTGSHAHVLSSDVGNLVWKNMPTEDSAFAMLETDKGQVLSLHSNAIQWRHKFDMDIICTNGYIALNGLLTSTRSYGVESITYYKKDLERHTGRLGKPREYTMCFDEDSSWDLEMGEFYDAVIGIASVRNGTAEEAVFIMNILKEIYQAGHNYK